MSVIGEDQDRRLIPRWRFANEAIDSAEFAGDPRLARPSRVERAFLDEKLAEWRHKPTVGRAIELLACGVGGAWLSEVRSAAEYLLEQQRYLSPQVIAVARHALQEDRTRPALPARSECPVDSGSVTFEFARSKVADARRRLQHDPRNMLSWLDLSRGYAILGHTSKAILAIERALHLTPHHRHALRSAARLFVHIGDASRAHRLLVSNPATPNDPWLMAAEISIASVANHRPRFAGQGRKLIDSAQLPPAHLTELQSAIGTLEYFNGAHRRAYKNLRASLEAPTDNAVAQARWIRTQLPGIVISDAAFQLPHSFEARCWRALEEGRWEDARTECLDWLCDEPFSSRPALVGSFIGVSLLPEPAFAIACARAGLQAEPDNSVLHNNIAVALAYQGELSSALAHFRQIVNPLPADFPAYVYVATAGLLAFRSGDIDQGRALYDKAEAIAPTDRRMRVAIFRAREELNAETPDAEHHLSRARRMAEEDESQRTKRLLVLLEMQRAGLTRAYNPARYDAAGDLSARNQLTPILARTHSLTTRGGTSPNWLTQPLDRRTLMPRNKASHTGHRSSVTGRFVKESYAKRYPGRTQKESIPNPGRGDAGRRKKT